MDLQRIIHTLRMIIIFSPMKRAEYLQKKKIFRHVGKNCMVMFRKIPLYSQLISLGDNVWIASNVSFITHDVIHHMLNYEIREKRFAENIGCIDIKDNVFIGSNTSILSNVTIGPNTIVGAGTLVNKNIQNGVYAGVPAKYICSMEDFMSRREQIQKSAIWHHGNGSLTEKEIELQWAAFSGKSVIDS